MTTTYAKRLAAAERGEKTFQGKPCAKHPESPRYVSNGICKACVTAKAKARQNVLRKLLAGPHPTDQERNEP